MKHYKTKLVADTDMYDKLDYLDYSEFDDDYYYEVVEERNNKNSKNTSRRKSSHYAHAFHDYVKDY